jgi:hypothetical protein
VRNPNLALELVIVTSFLFVFFFFAFFVDKARNITWLGHEERLVETKVQSKTILKVNT